MANQRVEAWPPLGLEDRRHRPGIGGVGPQAVHRLRAECDQQALAQHPRRALAMPTSSACSTSVMGTQPITVPVGHGKARAGGLGCLDHHSDQGCH